MNVKYCGPCLDYSGYGEANRHDVGALVAAGIDVTTEIPKYTLELSDFGKLGRLASELQDRKIDYKIKILHVTPNAYPIYFEVGKYHIGRVIWETDKLPDEFAKSVQMLDEVWTASEFNRKAILKSGVTKPIYVIPEAIDTDIGADRVLPYILEEDDCYKFYSIFEWTERKNPIALLTAFWQEFAPEEKVSLTVKTYIDNFTKEKQDEIDQNIKMAKKKLNLNYYAPVYLFKELMDRHQIYRFHRTFDCFVSTHRGEGWGIPQMEAMIMGKPIISTDAGGIHEYLTHRVNALLVNYKMIPLGEGNTRNKQWYTPDQNWAEVDIIKFREEMRWCFENKDRAAKVGKDGGIFVRTNFALPVVGQKMKQRLEEIEKNVA